MILESLSNDYEFIDLQNKYGFSVLSKASSHETLDGKFIELLLKNAATVKGLDIKQMVVERDQLNVADLLIKYSNFTFADSTKDYLLRETCYYKNDIANLYTKIQQKCQTCRI